MIKVLKFFQSHPNQIISIQTQKKLLKRFNNLPAQLNHQPNSNTVKLLKHINEILTSESFRKNSIFLWQKNLNPKPANMIGQLPYLNPFC